MEALVQTKEEVIRVAADWALHLCPPDLANSGKNAQLLVDYCLNIFGTVTAGGLTKAYNALRDKLDLVPPPVVPTKPTEIEIAAKLEAKMRRDFAESVKTNTTVGRQNFQEAEAAKKKSEALANELKTTQSQIEREIGDYLVGHVSGVTDYARTESGRDSLRKVRDRYDRRDINGARAALIAVRTAKSYM